MTIKNLARAVFAGLAYASVITVAVTIACAYLNGGQAIIHINRFGEQYLDLLFVAITVPGCAIVLGEYIIRLFNKME